MSQTALDIDFAAEFADSVRVKVSTLAPHDLQDIVDISDVEFARDSEYMASWRHQAFMKISEAANDGEEWALCFGHNLPSPEFTAREQRNQAARERAAMEAAR